MYFYQSGRHWLCNIAKPPRLEAKNASKVMGAQLPDSQRQHRSPPTPLQKVWEKLLHRKTR